MPALPWVALQVWHTAFGPNGLHCPGLKAAIFYKAGNPNNKNKMSPQKKTNNHKSFRAGT
jgi:hypothetical protein